MIDINVSISQNQHHWINFSNHLSVLFNDEKTVLKIEEIIFKTETNIIIILTSIHYYKKLLKKVKSKFSTKNVISKCKSFEFEVQQLQFVRKIEQMKMLFCDNYIIFVTLILIVSKIWYDIVPSNLVFSCIWNISLEKLSLSEKYILEILNYHIIINKEIIDENFNLLFVENSMKALNIKKRKQYKKNGILFSLFSYVGDGFPCCRLGDN